MNIYKCRYVEQKVAPSMAADDVERLMAEMQKRSFAGPVKEQTIVMKKQKKAEA